MKNTAVRFVTIVALAGTAALGLAACSSSSSNSGGTPATSSVTPSNATRPGTVVAPVIVPLSSINGTTVTVPLDNVIDLNSGTVPVTDWSAKITDPSIVQFVPGNDDGSATFNPGLQPEKVGTTTVTMTNSAGGGSVTFTVTVTAAAK
jgi:hypothetical protein